MIEASTWQMFGGLLGILVLLGGGALALQRMGIIQTKSNVTPAPAKGETADLSDRVMHLEKEVSTLNERTRKHEESLKGIGKIHQRIDSLAESSGRIEGEVSQMNRTLQTILRHMLGGESQ